MIEEITSIVTVAQVRTMADGGLRFIFDAPESETLTAAQLMECKRWGVVLKLTVEAIDDNEQERQSDGSGTIKRTKAKRRKPKGDNGM